MKRNNESGAALVEAALVIGTVVLLLVVFIDCCRYFSAKMLMAKAAQDAANLAAIIPNFEKEIVGRLPMDQAVRDFVEARNEVIEVAAGLPTRTVVGDANSSNMLKLAQFDLVDELDPLTTTNEIDALVLRPGESGRLHGSGDWIHHPVVCRPSATSGSNPCSTPASPGDTPRPRAGSERMESLLAKFPIVIETQASFQPIANFFSESFGTFTIKARAMAWRDQPARSGFREGLSNTTVTPPPEDPNNSVDNSDPDVNPPCDSGCRNAAGDCVPCGGGS